MRRSQGIHADDAEDSVFGTDEPAVALTEPGAKGADEEELSDEALALRLQQEELAAQNARFMQMAGIGMSWRFTQGCERPRCQPPRRIGMLVCVTVCPVHVSAFAIQMFKDSTQQRNSTPLHPCPTVRI